MATQTQTSAGGSKRQKRAHLQMFIQPRLYRLMRERAMAESLPVTTWLRLLAIRELRKKTSL
jgi:hypothetical protein